MGKRGVENDKKQGSGSGSGVDKDMQGTNDGCVKIQGAGSGSGVNKNEEGKNGKRDGSVKKRRSGSVVNKDDKGKNLRKGKRESGSGVNKDKKGNNPRSRERPRLCGICTRLYYDATSSPKRSRLTRVRMDQVVCLTNLAIRLYNIKELTNFAQVKLIKVYKSFAGGIEFNITFRAFSPLGVASVFQTRIRQFPGANPEIQFLLVRIKPSDSDYNGKTTQEDLPHDIHEQKGLSEDIKTLSSDSLCYLAPYLSQLALVMYNILTLRAIKDAVHDIPSVRVVEAMEHVVEDTNYLITFEAPLRGNSQKFETFQTLFGMPTLFPITTIVNMKVQIKHD